MFSKTRRMIPISFIYAHKTSLRYFSIAPDPYHLSPKAEVPKLRHIDLIKDLTGSPTDKIIKRLTTHLELQTMTEKTLLYKISLVKEMNLTDEKSAKVIPLLVHHPARLKNRYRALREYGIIPKQISSSHIYRFLSLCRSPVKKLKNQHLIREDCNVIMNLWKAADLTLSDCPKASDDFTLHSLKAIAIRAFFKEKLEMTDEAYEKNQKEIIYRLQNKSFETMNRNYYIFKDILELSKIRLCKNWFILFSDPDNTLGIMNRIKDIDNIDPKTCLHVYPKIATMTVENMEKSIQYIKEANIPLEHLQRCIKVLTLNCETIRERLMELKRNDFFLFNSKNPRIFELIHYQKKAKRRLELLHELNINVALTSLSSMTEKVFERYCESGGKLYGLDIIHYLVNELGISREKLSKKLKRHPRWTYVPIVTIGNNLKYLRNQFTDKEIEDNVYILFYSSERLKEAINNSNKMQMLKENEFLKKEHILPLALYFLEKESNFTGESIWELESNPYQDLPDLPSLKSD